MNRTLSADALEVLTTEQLAELLGCTPETVEACTVRGELPGVKFGRSWRYPRSAVLEVLHRLALQNTDKPASGNAVPMPALKRSRRRQPPPLQGA